MDAGYSGTPLAKKLGVKPGCSLFLLDAPSEWSVPGMPADVGVERRRRPTFAGAEVVVAFCRSSADVAKLAAAATSLSVNAALWVAWPRKAAGHVSDVTENLLRELLLPVGVVDVKVAALDDDWSGLKFVWRKENRR
ncbi:MAG TPA: hypothetical protein VFN80_10780 [Acidothermaceae bacterium]|nr:hypothetical protein [Acidothermaceae bacterium]